MANALDRELQQMIRANKTPSSRYVVRLHSVKTEKFIVLREAKLGRIKALGASSKSSATKSNGVDKKKGMAASFYAHCRTFAACKFDGVQDERVQCLELSVGQRMLQIAGLQLGGPSDQSAGFAEFAELYEKYKTGEDFSDEMTVISIQ